MGIHEDLVSVGRFNFGFNFGMFALEKFKLIIAKIQKVHIGTHKITELITFN